MRLVSTACLLALPVSYASDDEHALLQARQLLTSRSLNRDSFQGMTRSKNLLHEVTAMAHSLQTSSPEEVRAAISTAREALSEILPDLEEAHTRAAEQMSLQHGEIDACSRNMESGHSDTLDSQRQLKEQCVQDTAAARQRTIDECDNGWHAHVTALTARLPDCGATQPDAFHSMVAAWRSFVQDEWSIIDSEKSECDEATADEAALAPVCQERTSEFEGTFCRHRLMCSLTTACRAHEVEVFNAMRPGLEEDMLSRQQQFQTVSQVGCILDLVHDAMGTNVSISDAQLNACGDDVDLTDLTLTFPAMPESAPAVCQDPHSGEISCPDVDELDHPTSWTDGQADNIAPHSFEYLVVAGGGGGGSGGGGAGGVKQGSMSAAFAGEITVVVGAGGTHGSGGAGTSLVGTNGGNSAINTPEPIVAHGGGYGGDPSTYSGAEGGSGGGGRYDRPNDPRTNGIAGEGHGGGRSDRGSYGAGGGGGGAGARGSDAPRTHYGGNGGDGVQSDVGCVPGQWYGGGGGGGVNANDNSNGDGARGGVGGRGGGGTGSSYGGGRNNQNIFTGTQAEPNTGGGGGGTDPESSFGGDGASGIVKIKYSGPQFYEGGEVESCNGFTVHTFSTPGTHTLRAPLVSAGAGSAMGNDQAVPRDGLVSWFRVQDFDASSGTWSDYSSNGMNARVAAGALTVVQEEDGPALQGTTSTRVEFGDVIASTFTVASKQRYTGGRRGRILQGSGANWLHGHWNGQSCVAYYSGWITNPYPNTPDNDGWKVMIGQNAGENGGIMRCNGDNVRVNGHQGSTASGLFINGGNHGGETSDFQIREVITWNRALSEEEIITVEDYLNQV